MWKASFLVVALLTSTVPAQSEVIRVDSGDHASFTRLVVPLPEENTEWAITQIGERYLLTLDDLSVQFDLRNVFHKITGERLSKVTKLSPGQLQFELSCACEISAYRWKSRFIILDIRDGQSPENDPNDVTGSHSIPTGLTFHFGNPDTSLSTSIPQIELGRNLLEDSIDKQTLDEPISHASPTAQLPSPISLSERKLDLVQSVMNATSAGLLHPDEKPAQRAAPRIDLSTFDFAPNENEFKNLSISNAFESASEQSALSTQIHTAINCISDQDLDLKSWSSNGMFVERISELRANLFDEQQEIKVNLAIELAKAYLHYGMGTEATALFHVIPDEDAQTPTLRALATLLDPNVRNEVAHFSDQHTCPTSAALWSVIASSPEQKLPNLNMESVLASFVALPSNLREFLAAELSSKLLLHNKIEAAQKVIRFGAATTPFTQAAQDLVQGDIADYSGQNAQANKLYRASYQKDHADAPTAVSKLIESAYRDGDDVTTDVIDAVDAYSVEHREQPSGPTLRNSHFRARLANLEFNHARKVLEEVRKLDGETRYQVGLNEFAEHLVQSASDTDFLKATLNFDNSIMSRLKTSIGNDIAQRLLDLGIADAAAAFAATGAEGAIGRERRILRAKIALALNDPKTAEAHLLGLDGDDLLAIKAETKKLEGNMQAAAMLFRRNGDLEVAEQLAWQNGDLIALRGNDQSIRGEAIALLETSPSPLSEFESLTLANGQTKLDESEKTRNTIDRLLVNYQVQTAPAQ